MPLVEGEGGAAKPLAGWSTAVGVCGVLATRDKGRLPFDPTAEWKWAWKERRRTRDGHPTAAHCCPLRAEQCGE